MKHLPSNSATSVTLLQRLREDPDDQASWQQFVGRYGQMIESWCLRWNLQPSDAADVTQNVLLAIAKQMKDFHYDPSKKFRGWLKTIAYRSWCDFLAHRKRQAMALGGDDALEILDNLAVQSDFLEEFDREYERGLLEDAMSLVRQRVNEVTWQAFVKTASENQPAKSVAEQLSISVGTVYVYKGRVQKMIQEEIRLMEQVVQ